MMDASQFSHDLFLRILAVSAQASLLALLIVALQRLLRDWLSPAWRYALWILLPARLLLLWTVPSAWSLSTLLHNAWTGARAVVLAPATQAYASGEPFTNPLPAGAPAISAMQLAVSIWLFGAAVALALALLQACRLNRQARRRAQVTDAKVIALLDECRRAMGLRRRVPLLCGPDTGSPGLLGFLRPRLLVPARLLSPDARDHLRCVLLHELAHIRRQDVLTGWLAYLLLSLHWFNPVLWWAKRRCIDDRELACDARVLSLLTPAERRAYGHALLDQFRAASPSFSSPGLVGVLEGSSSIERRIEMITAFGPPARKGTLPALAAILLLAVTALTGAEETVTANPPAAVNEGVSVAPETAILLARETAPTQRLPLPVEVTAAHVPRPQAVLTAEASAAAPISSAEPKQETPSAPVAAAPAKADLCTAGVSPALSRTAGVSSALSRTAAIPPAVPSATAQRNKKNDKGGRDARDTTATAPTPAAPETTRGADTQTETNQPAAKNPATLHKAINKAAKDYADSLEVKSTRPGEDLPFTLTVGGSIQVRGEYRSGMPKQGRYRLPQDGFTPSMRTRVSLCADFGQVQCAVEASKTQHGTGYFGPRDVD